MKPPPPMLPAVGCVTARAKAVATAASTAGPPSFNTSLPIWDAMTLAEITMLLRARTGVELADGSATKTTTTHAASRSSWPRPRRHRKTASGVMRLRLALHLGHPPAQADQQKSP